MGTKKVCKGFTNNSSKRILPGILVHTFTENSGAIIFIKNRSKGGGANLK